MLQLIWATSYLRLRAPFGLQPNTFRTIQSAHMMIPRDGLPPGIRFIRPLARPLEDREVWQAKTADGALVAVKFVNDPWTIERLPWLSGTIDHLQASGYPVPPILWRTLRSVKAGSAWRWSACQVRPPLGSVPRSWSDSSN